MSSGAIVSVLIGLVLGSLLGVSDLFFELFLFDKVERQKKLQHSLKLLTKNEKLIDANFFNKNVNHLKLLIEGILREYLQTKFC